jgi:hypothetical protein
MPSFSTGSLRLHFDTPCGVGPVLVATENTAMGHPHIHHQPLRRPLGTRAYRLLLLFRSPTGLNGGPRGPEMLPAAQISPISRDGSTDNRWRYRTFCAPVKESDSASTAILLTRVYALWDRNRVILWGLLAYCFGFVGFAAVHHSSSSGIPFQFDGLSVGNYPREIPTLSPGTAELTGMRQHFIAG